MKRAVVESVQDVGNQLVEALLGLETTLARYRAATAREYGVAVHDLLLLGALARGGGRATPRELAGVLQVSSGTLTSMLDRVEQAGLLARSPNPTDRRSVLVDLTAEGRQAVGSLTRGLRRSVGAGLPARSRETVVRALTELAGRLDELTAQLAANGR